MNRDELSVHPAEAAKALLGRVLGIPGEGLLARITEVEAYGGPADSPWPDPGAHTWPGPTPRNRVMFGPAGHLYVYRSYGIHFCANVTAGPDGIGGGVLLRGAEILEGEAIAMERRKRGNGGVVKHALARGPGNLGQALGVDLGDYGQDLFGEGSRVRLLGGDRADDVIAGPRVGLRAASERPWRFRIPGAPGVSSYRRHAKADGRA
ncbi:DNA-3-methyladenine glycosylase [Corynebacterium sp. NPDC060344]|uniref:DNA-3-methyladenine glycosylase n=1 Tax=Corynebacterium sp. NPDC060344 TaxID=3347101 RepID=UPI00365979AD